MTTVYTVSFHGEAPEIAEHEYDIETVALCIAVSEVERAIVTPFALTHKAVGPIAVHKEQIYPKTIPMPADIGIRYCVFRE